MNWYLEVLKKYAVFSGRARRKEYWMFVLFNFIIIFVLELIGGGMRKSYSVPSTIYQLAVLVPSIAVGVRRMHDTNHNGWWIICPVVNLVFAVTEGTKGENRYGPDSKAAAL